MCAGRKLVVFTTEQFYAVVGRVMVTDDPYGVSLTDIFNDRSAGTHLNQDHEHRPGRIFLSDAELYALHDNSQRVCTMMREVYIPLKTIRAAVDVHPERYRGNAEKRLESEGRKRYHRELAFTLHGSPVRGVADSREVYRRSEQFVGLTAVSLHEEPVVGLSVGEFLRRVGCLSPAFMAVNMQGMIHS